jgi:hypothetical protein
MRRQTQLVLETNGSSIREGLLSLRGWPGEESSLLCLRISPSSRNFYKRDGWFFKTGEKLLCS